METIEDQIPYQDPKLVRQERDQLRAEVVHLRLQLSQFNQNYQSYQWGNSISAGCGYINTTQSPTPAQMPVGGAIGGLAGQIQAKTNGYWAIDMGNAGTAGSG